MIKYFISALSVTLGIIELNAQTALTADMVWRDGTRWIRCYENDTHNHAEFVLRQNINYSNVLDIKQIRLDGSESSNALGYIQVEGNKVYGCVPPLGENMDRYLMYDFDDWENGGTTTFCAADHTNYNYESGTYGVFKWSDAINNLHLMSTDPDGKYYGYAYTAGENGPLRVKGLGRIESDNGIQALAGYELFGQIVDGNVMSENKILECVLEVSNPEYGILFRHPDYDKYMPNEDDPIEITPAMTWRDGTRWRVFSETTREATDYVLKAGSYNGVECFNICTSQPNGSEVSSEEYVLLDGYKVYGIFPFVTDKNNEHPRYTMYDFNQWVSGGLIEVSGINKMRPVTTTGWYDKFRFTFEWKNMNRMITDPDGKYYAYSYRYFSNELLWIRGLGIIESDGVLNVMATHIISDSKARNDGYAATNKIEKIVLEVSNPEYGILFRHPDYDKYSGISNVPADDTEPEISVDGGVLHIRTAGPTDVHVYTVMGLEVHGGRVDGETSIALPGGIYVVQVGSVTRKVML